MRPHRASPGQTPGGRLMQSDNPTAAILLIGDEILSGRTRDLNAHHLAGILNGIGIDLREIRVVPDDHAAIVAALRALDRHLGGDWDMVFTSGGIGPTHDDITADAVADAYGVGIEVNADARRMMEERWTRLGMEITPARLRMARIPVGATLIENAAKMMGMPLGPLQLVDETSIDLGVKIAKATRAAMGDAYPDDAVDEVIFAMADKGRMGKKANAGFYAYDEAGKRQGLWDELGQQWPQSDDQPELTEVQHRLMFAQALEAVRALEAGVLEDIREGDVGAILGWGFAPWSGGPFGWLDMLGAKRAAAIADQLTEAHGERFATPPLLREMAEKGETFYGRFGPKAKAAA